jgi:MFS family permease
MALAVYALGASAGSGCAFLFGGVLVDVVTSADAFVLPLLGEVRPWQAVFLIIGVPGIFFALLSFTMPEPARRGRLRGPAAQTPGSLVESYRALFRFMRSRSKFFSMHYTGFGLASLGIVGGTAWYPAHMARTFGWSGTEIGLGLGFAYLAGGVVGKLSCGAIVKYLFERGYKDAPFRWYAIALLLAVPPGVVGLTSDNPWVFLVGFTLLQMLITPLNVVYVASLNLVTPNELRGSGVALFSATVGLVAMSLGAILIAAISEYVYGGNAIGMGLATLFGFCLPLGAFALFAGRAAMAEAVTAAEAWG